MNTIRSFFQLNKTKLAIPHNRTSTIQPQLHRCRTSKTNAEPLVEDNKPIRFTTSDAHKWQAGFSRVGREDTRLWYEPHVIIASLACFLCYFTILREENDIDTKLTASLYSQIDGLEEQQLRSSLEYNMDRNLPVQDIVKRLKELEAERK